jgi:hypothetical protein
MFRYLVLGLLRDGEPRHGYAVMKEYRERSGLQVNTGSFYRELQRLVAEGLVQTVANPTDADPRRAPYQITETGSACFDVGSPGLRARAWEGMRTSCRRARCFSPMRNRTSCSDFSTHGRRNFGSRAKSTSVPADPPWPPRAPDLPGPSRRFRSFWLAI